MKYRCFTALFAAVLVAGTLPAGAQYSYAPADAWTSYSLPAGAGPYTWLALGPSVAQDGRLTHFGGPVNSDVEYDVGFAAFGAIGFAFNKYVAAEFETGGIGAQLRSAEGFFMNDTFLDNVPFLVNVTLSYPIPRTRCVPYIGAGAGGSLTFFHTDGFGDGSTAVFGDDSDWGFAWQAFAGMRINLADNLSLNIGYSYFTTDDTSFSYPPAFPGSGPNLRVGFDGVQMHSVLIALQMKF